MKNEQPDHQRLYFVNAPTDLLAIGGLSVAALLLVKAYPAALITQRFSLAAILLLVVNWPHFSATSFRLYHRRKNLAQYPLTASIVPLVVATGVAASLAFPSLIAPVFIKLFLLWSSYHFSGQTVGITLLYARRSGTVLSDGQRKALSGFVFATFLWPMSRFETSTAGASYFGINYPGFGIPAWVPPLLQVAMWTCAASLALSLLLGSLKTKKLPPAIFFVPAVTQYAWFVAGANAPGYTELVPAFHGLQYLLIAWAMHLSETLGEGKRKPGRAFVLGESARWFGLNVIGGVILFYLLPRAAIKAGIEEGLAQGVLIAGIQIHHFFVDGVIWKLKSSAVSSPLKSTLADLLGPRQPQPELSAPAMLGGQQ